MDRAGHAHCARAGARHRQHHLHLHPGGQAARERTARKRARIGLFMAMFTRIGLLLVLAWIVRLAAPLFTVFAKEISGRDLILIVGGLFLVWPRAPTRSTTRWRARRDTLRPKRPPPSPAVIVQIMLIDIVFSLDSIITAVGMVDDVRIMIAAVIIAVVLMMLFARRDRRVRPPPPDHQDARACSFLVVIGVVLIAEGFDHHVPKGYVYFAMAFSVAVEMLNLKMRGRAAAPVKLREPYIEGEGKGVVPGPD
ncbi:MAG: TerC family protein [Candidatus Manganitrophus sp.]|nr:MAG: TerC family protein [Candidatus Manganitrophus sp.]